MILGSSFKVCQQHIEIIATLLNLVFIYRLNTWSHQLLGRVLLHMQWDLVIRVLLVFNTHHALDYLLCVLIFCIDFIFLINLVIRMEVLLFHIEEFSLELFFFFVDHAKIISHEFIHIDVVISGTN